MSNITNQMHLAILIIELVILLNDLVKLLFQLLISLIRGISSITK